MDAESASPWRFAQCFGDKGDADDITEGELYSRVRGLRYFVSPLCMSWKHLLTHLTF